MQELNVGKLRGNLRSELNPIGAGPEVIPQATAANMQILMDKINELVREAAAQKTISMTHIDLLRKLIGKT